MTKRIAAMALAIMLMSLPAMAQDGEAAADGADASDAAATVEAAETHAASQALITFSGSFGAGIVILGAGLGIGKIGATAVESMARQPEVAGNIQTAMIIAAALLEGVTFFALIICIMSA